MRKALKTASGINLLIEEKPFASGGEGALHKIITNTHKDFCVKLYKPKYCIPEREKKITYMVQNPPTELQSDNYKICWAKEAVYDGSQFVGFMMPLAYSDSIELYELCMPKLKKNLPAIWQNKYDRNEAKGVQARLKLCVNIATAIHSIHSLQKYTLVDMKPQNMLITHDGKISIIDLDSVQIAEGRQVLFSAQVATPEYVPTEGNKLNPAQDYIPETWDRFSLAVIFYELIFGIHPYTATFKHPYQNCETVPSKIEKGLFVHGTNKTHIQVLPPPHQNFDILPYNIKRLFLIALDEGHQNAQLRPKAETWGKTLFAEVGKVSITLPTKKAEVKMPTIEVKQKSPISLDLDRLKNVSKNSPTPQYTNSEQDRRAMSSLAVVAMVFLIIFLVNFALNRHNQQQTTQQDSLIINTEPLLSTEILGNWTWESKEGKNTFRFEENGVFLHKHTNFVIKKGKWQANDTTKTLEIIFEDNKSTFIEQCHFENYEFHFREKEIPKIWKRSWEKFEAQQNTQSNNDNNKILPKKDVVVQPKTTIQEDNVPYLFKISVLTCSHIKEFPNSSSKVITTICENTDNVKVLSSDKEYYYVIHKGIRGYVSRVFVNYAFQAPK